MVWTRVADIHHNLIATDVTFNVSNNLVSFGSPGPSHPGWFWVWVGGNIDLTCCIGGIGSGQCTTLNTTNDLIKGRDGSERLDYIIQPLRLVVGWG